MDITGNHNHRCWGSSGTGFGVAQADLAKKAEVIIVGRPPEQLAQASEDLVGGGERMRSIATDIISEDEVHHLFKAVRNFGHLFISATSHLAYQPIRNVDLEAALAGLYRVYRRAIPKRPLGSSPVHPSRRSGR